MGDAGPRATPEPSEDRPSMLPQVIVAVYLAIRVPFGLSYLPDLRPEHRMAVGVLITVILLAPIPLVFGGTRRLRPGRAVGLLAVLAVVTYGPLALTGEWPLPLAGCLACAGLLLLRFPFSWLLFVAVVAGEGVIRLLLDQPFYLVSYGVTATVNTGLSLFALGWFITLARELHTTRARYAEAAAARDRLESAWSVREALVGSLAQIEDAGHRALESLTSTPGRARTEIEELTRVARRALSQVRAVAAAHRDPLSTGPSGRNVPGARLTWLILVILAVTFAGQQIILVGAEPGTTWRTLVLAVLLSVGIAALMVRHASIVLRDAPPKGWPITLALQALLTLGPFLLFGSPWNVCFSLLAVACLFLVRSPWRWVSAAAIVAAQSLAWLMWDMPLLEGTHQMTSLISQTMSLYAAARVAELATRLDAVRTRLAVMAVLNERIRLSRDIHDLLGLGLSAITLKAELAVRRIDTDPGRAREELTEVVGLTARSLAQARAVTSQDEHVLTLDEEVTEARAALTAAGADVRLDLADAPLPPELDTTLAVLLRESVTNILRHAVPAHCTIKTTVNNGVLWLRVDNDGVLEETREGGGAGLANLAARAQTMGGVLTAAHDGNGRFSLDAELPLVRPGEPAGRRPPYAG